MLIKKIMLDNSAYLEAYIANRQEQYKRKAILVIPGGGYGSVWDITEGEPIAMAFIPYGFNAFILHYSVAREKVFPAQLIQASMAIKHIKENATEYDIDENEIFAVGFSAGGHLAASLGTMWNRKEMYDAIDMKYGYNKPKGVMLIYPVVTADKRYAHEASFQNLFGTDNPTEEELKNGSIENDVTTKACPAYIVHAANDALVPVENSLILAMQYSKFKIPFELHIYPNGGHGFALGNEITFAGNPEHIQKANEKWVENAVKWANKLSGK